MQYSAHLCFAETSHTYEAFIVVDGHNSRNNGTGNSNLTTVVDKFEENVSVIEQLSYN